MSDKLELLRRYAETQGAKVELGDAQCRLSLLKWVLEQSSTLESSKEGVLGGLLDLAKEIAFQYPEDQDCARVCLAVILRLEQLEPPERSRLKDELLTYGKSLSHCSEVVEDRLIRELMLEAARTELPERESLLAQIEILKAARRKRLLSSSKPGLDFGQIIASVPFRVEKTQPAN